MNTLKTEKELLLILRNYINAVVLSKKEEKRNSGLCSAIYWVYVEGFILFEEQKRLMEIIKDNKPRNTSIDGFYFPKGQWDKRCIFLEELIVKYS